MSAKDKNHSEITFNTQVGTKATVQRRTVGAEQATEPNRILAKLGIACHPDATREDSATQYMGSAAVHIYWNDLLQQVFFVSQTDGLRLYRCPELLAVKASEDFVQSIKQTYGHKRQVRRSGF
jgi:hypothetical protein